MSAFKAVKYCAAGKTPSHVLSWSSNACQFTTLPARSRAKGTVLVTEKV